MLATAVALSSTAFALGDSNATSAPASDTRAPKAGATASLLVETGTLSAEESALLARIREFHPDFKFTTRVKRFHDGSGGDRRLAYSEIQFESVDGLILGEFISYTVGFPASLQSVQFSYDAGTAFRGYGSLHVTGDSITKVEISCGTSGCSEEVMVNGELVYPAP